MGLVNKYPSRKKSLAKDKRSKNSAFDCKKKEIADHNIDKVKDELNARQIQFCKEYTWDWNATRAYQAVYKGVKSYSVAGVCAHQLLKNPKIQEFIKSYEADLEKSTGITRRKIADELRKIGFSSIAHLHKNWITLHEFEQLTDEQKASIQEIDTKVIKKNLGTKENPEYVDVEYVRIKLYDKRGALNELNRMYGNHAPERIDHTTKGQPLPAPIQISIPQIIIIESSNKDDVS